MEKIECRGDEGKKMVDGMGWQQEERRGEEKGGERRTKRREKNYL